jgi:threonine synthase
MPRASASPATSSFRTILEPGKVVGSAIYQPKLMAIRGNYDDVNRLCTQIADKYRWGFANINLRTYYAEGAKTFGFEIVEQLGWRCRSTSSRPSPAAPCCRASPRLPRGAHGRPRRRADAEDLRGAGRRLRAGGQALHAGIDHPDPVRPDTIAKSIAIGNPADGFQVIEVLKETGGWAEMVTDDEIRAGIHLLAETEGIFTEPAGGTTMAVTKKLIDQGRIPRDESIVVCITGNGYKTSEVVADGAVARRSRSDARSRSSRLVRRAPRRGDRMKRVDALFDDVLVQKYGGSSVATPEKVIAVAGRIGTP